MFLSICDPYLVNVFDAVLGSGEGLVMKKVDSLFVRVVAVASMLTAVDFDLKFWVLVLRN